MDKISEANKINFDVLYNQASVKRQHYAQRVDILQEIPPKF